MKSFGLISSIGFVCVLALAGWAHPNGTSHLETVSTKHAATPTFSPYVDHQGNIRFPDGFKSWQHLGSWAVIGEEQGESALHNVYASIGAVEGYMNTGEFPDGTVLVKEVMVAPNAEHTTGNAYWAEKVSVRFVMIKDAVGRFSEHPLWGEGWGWAMFQGKNTMKQAATDFRNDCLGCHVPAKESDWIYVYGYPALGKAVAGYSPLAKTEMDAVMGAMARAREDTERLALGERLFGQCKACHSTEKGRHKVGPSLAGIAGRKAGSAEGYKYSKAMKDADFIWDENTLDMHLSDVKGFVPGNKMAVLFRRNIQDASTRRVLIEYLLSL